MDQCESCDEFYSKTETISRRLMRQIETFAAMEKCGMDRFKKAGREPVHPCPVGFGDSISELPALRRCRQYAGAASISERKRLAID